jgi:hypothetical protein
MADQRRTRHQWQALVEGWAESGLTQKAYCTQQGISVTSFHRWREQLDQEAAVGDQALPEAAPIRLLPVQRHEAPTPLRSGPALTLVLATGLRVEVESHFEAETLRRLLGVVQGTVAA